MKAIFWIVLRKKKKKKKKKKSTFCRILLIGEMLCEYIYRIKLKYKMYPKRNQIFFKNKLF